MSRRSPALCQGGGDLPKHTLVGSRGGAQPGPPQRPRSRLPAHTRARQSPCLPAPLPKLRTGASWRELLAGRPTQSELVARGVPAGSSHADFRKNGRDASVQVRAAWLLRAFVQLPPRQEREPGPSGRQHDPGSKGPRGDGLGVGGLCRLPGRGPRAPLPGRHSRPAGPRHSQRLCDKPGQLILPLLAPDTPLVK